MNGQQAHEKMLNIIREFRLKQKNIWKTTRSFRYDLNPLQLYSGSDKYSKGIRSDRVPEELWTKVHYIVQDSDQNHPQEKEMQKGKMVI